MIEIQVKTPIESQISELEIAKIYAPNEEIIIKHRVTHIVYERFLFHCGIAFAAIIGSFMRIGISYFKIWKTETNYVSTIHSFNIFLN